LNQLATVAGVGTPTPEQAVKQPRQMHQFRWPINPSKRGTFRVVVPTPATIADLTRIPRHGGRPAEKLVRNFPENGPKLLLEHPFNIRDLLRLLHDKRAEGIDFAAMTIERTHFVKPHFEHVALDLLFKAPFRATASGPRKTIFIYLLIEHQSMPERFFMLRLGDYLHESYKMQKKTWDKKHDSDAKFLLQPIIPIVLYTGDRNWERVEKLAGVVEAGEMFADVIPEFKPLFLNLRHTADESLMRDGGFFGKILRLIKQRKAEPEVFRRVLEEVVGSLEKMTGPDSTRWRDFLYYIHVLLYHSRSGEEQKELNNVIDRSISEASHQKEKSKMGRTIAEVVEEKGMLIALRTTLLRYLRKRFKKVPRQMEAHISATTDVRELNTWLDNVLDAKTLADVGIQMD
jgi:Putative transposase, YhgA-like